MKLKFLTTLACAIGIAGCANVEPKAINPAGATVQSSLAAMEVAAVVDSYARSVNTMDLVLAEQIWITNESSTFIHPRGHERGWVKIKDDFYGKTMNATFSERNLVTRDLKVNIYGDAAYVEFYWNFEAKFRKDGSVHRTAGRESQMLLRTPSGWRIAHINYSSMPVTGERQGF